MACYIVSGAELAELAEVYTYARHVRHKIWTQTIRESTYVHSSTSTNSKEWAEGIECSRFLIAFQTKFNWCN